MDQYIITEACVFNKVKEKWGELSNMSNDYGVTIGGVKIKNTEALYQACRFPDFPDYQAEILKGHSGMASKMTSKKYRKLYTREDWHDVRVEVMDFCLRLKFYQNSVFIKRILNEVGNRDIVEKSHKDQLWGTVERNGLLIGDNILGKLWMNIRDEMDILNGPPEVNISNFKLLNKIITTDACLLAKDRKLGQIDIFGG